MAVVLTPIVRAFDAGPCALPNSNFWEASGWELSEK
jgi:hypothetical protein